MNAEKTKENRENSGELINIERVEETPFTIITDKETELCFIAIGESRITDWMTEEEAIRRIKVGHWELIWATAITAAIKTVGIKELEKTIDEKKPIEGTFELQENLFNNKNRIVTINEKGEMEEN